MCGRCMEECGTKSGFSTVRAQDLQPDRIEIRTEKGAAGSVPSYAG